MDGMMENAKIFFYGAGKNGKDAAERFRKFQTNKQYCFIGYIDKNKTGEYCGYPIIPVEEIDPHTIIVITVESPKVTSEIYKELKQRGFQKLFWYIKKNTVIKKEMDFLKSNCISCENWGMNLLPQVEMHAADCCNLNCKGCTHFSPIFDETMPEINARIQDVIKLKNKFSHILRFFLLGGEPLLNKELPEYVHRIRQILPDTDLVVVTNGLLIPALPENVLESMKENDIKISISEYGPTNQIIEKIINKIEKYDIAYSIRPYDRKQKFNKPLSLSKNSRHPHRCISNGCINIWEGKIARCPSLMYIDVFNKKFGTCLPNSGIFELDTFVNGQELLAELEKDVPLCKHCIENEIEWERCEKEVKLHDFAVCD